MARVSRVGLGWDVADRISWYADIDSWLTAESLIDYGSVIEAVCKGDIGGPKTSTTETVPPYGWYAYADPSVYWNPDGSTQDTAPQGDRIYFSTPNGKIAGLKFTSSNGFASALRVNSTAINFVAEDCYIEHTHASPASGAEAFRAISTTVLSERPILRRCFVNQINGGQASIRQATYGGHILLESCLSYNPDERYAIASSAGQNDVIDSFGFGASTGDGWAGAALTLQTTASQDASGTAGLTGITQAALVDFAADDVRTATGGALDVTGTNQAFIGLVLGGAVSDGISLNELSGVTKYFKDLKQVRQYK